MRNARRFRQTQASGVPKSAASLRLGSPMDCACAPRSPIAAIEQRPGGPDETVAKGRTDQSSSATDRLPGLSLGVHLARPPHHVWCRRF